MSKIQSVVFSKRYWNVTRARRWLARNGLKSDGKVDKKEDTYRFRQRDPSDFVRFRTKMAQPSIKLIIGFPY